MPIILLKKKNYIQDYLQNIGPSPSPISPISSSPFDLKSCKNLETFKDIMKN